MSRDNQINNEDEYQQIKESYTQDECRRRYDDGFEVETEDERRERLGSYPYERW